MTIYKNINSSKEKEGFKKNSRKKNTIKNAINYAIFPLLLFPNSCNQSTKYEKATKNTWSIGTCEKQAEYINSSILNSILEHTKQLNLTEKGDYLYYNGNKITKENFIKKLNLEKSLKDKDKTLLLANEYIQALPKETRDSRYNAIKKSSKLKYDKKYKTNETNTLTKEKGRIEFNGHTETFYSQKELPGKDLKIPGRHTAQDGTIRDKYGYIAIACNSINGKVIKKGTVIKTSLGPGKVYDRLESEDNHVDIYTNR